MGDPTWGDIMQLGVVGPIVWLLYRMLPILAKVGEAFTRMEARIDSHCSEQAELVRHHEEREAQSWAEQMRWNDVILRKLNGAKGGPTQGS